MNEITIDRPLRDQAFTPGERVPVTVAWDLEAAPQRVVCELLWYTEGKGTEDIGVVDHQEFFEPGVVGRKDVVFELPRLPYSFSGKLISLVWAVEARVEPRGPVELRPIVMGPGGREIRLGESAGP